MVEQTMQLNLIFQSLSDPTRRDILCQVTQSELSIGELVEKYQMSFAAISKHLKMLEKAKLVQKRREGKKYMITLAPNALEEADKYLEQYRLSWESRYNKLDTLLKQGERDG